MLTKLTLPLFYLENQSHLGTLLFSVILNNINLLTNPPNCPKRQIMFNGFKTYKMFKKSKMSKKFQMCLNIQIYPLLLKQSMKRNMTFPLESVSVNQYSPCLSLWC